MIRLSGFYFSALLRQSSASGPKVVHGLPPSPPTPLTHSYCACASAIVRCLCLHLGREIHMAFVHLGSRRAVSGRHEQCERAASSRSRRSSSTKASGAKPSGGISHSRSTIMRPWSLLLLRTRDIGANLIAWSCLEPPQGEPFFFMVVRYVALISSLEQSHQTSDRSPETFSRQIS